MRMDKMTSKFQMALAEAQSLAVGRDHQFIEPVHLMIALLDQEGGSVRHLLAQADVNVNLLRSQLGELLEKLPQVQGTAGEVHVSNDLGRLLNVTDKLAQQRKDACSRRWRTRAASASCCARPVPARACWSRPSTACAAASR
jgi:ATP-dependent Clp protease ATP-binding subunit ClpB